MLEIRKIEIIKDKFNIFGHKISRPLAFKEIYGINQLGAIDRDGSYSSWDFTATPSLFIFMNFVNCSSEIPA